MRLRLVWEGRAHLKAGTRPLDGSAFQRTRAWSSSPRLARITDCATDAYAKQLLQLALPENADARLRWVPVKRPLGLQYAAGVD